MGTDSRRFERPDPRAALEAEVVLLREENARLKRRRHEQHDVTEALARARSLRSLRGDPADESEQMLVQGLVIRESLIELCRELQQAMVLFEARVDALADAADQLVPVPGRREQG
jgi:hypothetical protein